MSDGCLCGEGEESSATREVKGGDVGTHSEHADT